MCFDVYNIHYSLYGLLFFAKKYIVISWYNILTSSSLYHYYLLLLSLVESFANFVLVLRTRRRSAVTDDASVADLYTRNSSKTIDCHHRKRVCFFNIISSVWCTRARSPVEQYCCNTAGNQLDVLFPAAYGSVVQYSI